MLARSFRAPASLALGSIAAAILIFAPTPALGQPEKVGEWKSEFDWPNVGIHVHVLPTGKVLFWGRREAGETLDPHNCTPRIWDPKSGSFTNTPQPGFNLFCSGHTFLADGRLLVVGGHISDGTGVKKATIYDPQMNTWTAIGDMNKGRWYPSALTMPNGSVLVSSGAVQPNQQNNPVQQILDANSVKFRNIVDFQGLPLYPRLHVAADGRAFMSGHLRLTQLLDASGPGQWEQVGQYAGKQREDGCSVMFDTGKVLIVGGGIPPQETAEVIDLDQMPRAWKPTGKMAHPRRHHNATILADGTVLVTGGTSGSGDPHPFNDLSKPVKQPELWDPATGNWTVLAEEKFPRLYHSTAVLLPDARVLSAGGGEYRLPNGHANAAQDTLRNGQIFSPPYLFRGDRPNIIKVSSEQVSYGKPFEVETTLLDKIGHVNWVRLPSVTHSLNMNQRINFLKFTSDGKKLTVTPPASANLCPPGHYMLFVLTKDNVPSEAKIVNIQ